MKQSHFDPAKRQTIKLLSGSAIIAAVPVVATNAMAKTGAGTDSIRETSLTASGAELSLSLLVDDETVLKMTNNTDHLVIVRHVHPGIVHAGDKVFDLNAAFKRSAYAISGGSTRSVVLNPIDRLAGETEFSRSRYRNMPQRIVSVTGSDKRGLLLNSTRSFYA